MKLEEVRNNFLDQIKAGVDPHELLKAKELKDLYREIPKLPVAERSAFGQKINALKSDIQAAADEYAAKQEAASVESLDVTAPFDVSTKDHTAAHPDLLPVEHSSLHPLTLELQHVVDVFTRMGFECHEARQIDDDYHMFTSLNFPPNHPARDGYDTFRTEEGYIPPAHTTAMENRTLKAGKAKLEAGGQIAEIHYGRVFRNEDADVTHDHTFNQIEGVFVSREPGSDAGSTQELL